MTFFKSARQVAAMYLNAARAIRSQARVFPADRAIIRVYLAKAREARLSGAI